MSIPRWIRSRAWTTVGAIRSSRLTASPDFLMCDPLPPHRNAPWDIEGRLGFRLCPFPDDSADVNQSWCQSVQPFDSLPRLLNVCPLKKPPSAPLCLEGQFVWRIFIPRWIIMQMCSKFWGQSVQLFDSFPILLNLWHPNPPGRLVFSLCPFQDESAKVNQSWCQSDSFPRLLNCWPPKPPKCPLVSRGAIYLAYIHSHMNLHTCAKFGASRPSRLVAFPEFVLRVVRLFAAVRADSRKNTPKTNIYTSKIIIPARTCRHQRH